jgi:MFS family permease
MSATNNTSVISLTRLKQFPAIVWVVLASSFFVRGTYYAVWPFLAVILYKKFQLTATEVGLILTTVTVISTLIGAYVGNLSDRFGRNAILLASVTMGVGAYALLAIADSLPLLIASIFLATLPQSMWSSPSKAVMADALPETKTRELALQSNYFLVNAGAALGPLLGVWAGLTGQQSSFMFTSIAYLGVLTAMVIVLKSNATTMPAQQKSSHNLRQTLKILASDHMFLLLTLANILIAFIYAQLESSLIQYLTRANAPELITLIASMIVLNATTIVLLQFPLLKLMENMTVKSRCQIGIVLLGLSQLGFAFNPIDSYYGWLVITFVLSIGEAILFPNINIQIDQMAPAHLRGSYFGAASLYALGYGMAPLIGGIILDVLGGPALFIITAGLSLVTIVMYLVSNQLKRPDFILNNNDNGSQSTPHN